MIKDYEHQGMEFKKTIENFRDISKTSCAFANSYGGKIIVGITDKGEIIGIPEEHLDLLQQRMEGAIQQISPVPFHKILIEERKNKKIIVVEIYPIGQGSFCTFKGIVYYRSGSVNTKLEGNTLQSYLVKRQILSFDESLSQATLDDIDKDKLQEFLKKRSPSLQFEESKIQEYLLNLNVAQNPQNIKLKNTAVLFFAKNMSKFIPQNEMKLVRFKGTEPIDIIDSSFVNLTITGNLKEAETFIRKNTRTAFEIKKLERKEIPEYPSDVVREALVNALTHRDYFNKNSTQINIFDNRIEFINPGALPEGLSLKILGTLSIQRNPLTYKLMRDLGLVEGLATGIPRMRKSLREAGLPEPDFEELGNFFKLTVYNKESGEVEFNNRQKNALKYLKDHESITALKYEKDNKISKPTAVSDLNDLCKKGLLKKVGKTRGSYYILVKGK